MVRATWTPMNLKARCVAHPAAAGWQCSGCEALLCPACTASHRVGHTPLEICTRCGELAYRLTQPRSETASYLQRLTRALGYPFEPGNLGGLVGIALLLTLFLYFRALGIVMACILVARPFILLIRFTSIGKPTGWSALLLGSRQLTAETLDQSAESADRVDRFIVPLVRVALATMAWLLPLWIYVTRLKTGDTPLRSDPVVYSLAFLGCLFLPVGLLVAATESPVLDLLNPLANFRRTRALGRDYLWCLLALFGCVAVAVPLPLLAAKLTGWFGAFLLRWLSACVGVYALFLAGRVLGLLLYVRGAEVGYGRPEYFRDPVLPNASPRAVHQPRLSRSLERAAAAADSFVDTPAPPPEQVLVRRAAIELSAELALPGSEPSAATSGPVRVAPTELDASKLRSSEELFAQLVTDLVGCGDVLGAFDAWRAAPTRPPQGISPQTLLSLGRSALTEDQPALAAEIFTAAAGESSIATEATALLAEARRALGGKR